MTRYCLWEKIELTANQVIEYQNEHLAYEVRLRICLLW